MIVNQELVETKKVILSHKANSLKLIGKELWSCQEDGISVYNKNLKHVRKMLHLGTMDVAALSNDELVIAGLRFLKVISKTGK